MNDLFVNVKVDREERPDVDALTMDACVTMTGPGRLADDGLPDARRAAVLRGHVLPARAAARPAELPQLLHAIAEAWRERRDDLEEQAARLVAALGGAARLEAGDAELSAGAARRGRARARARLRARVRRLRHARRSSRRRRRSSCCSAAAGRRRSAMVRRTLDGMAAGGLYDVVGGGFHRYSVDARWLVPHFEKMLYDNALLASAYLHAWVVTGEERYRSVVEETIDYLLREMRLPERRVRLRAGRGHRRRRGAHVHLDARGVGGARARPDAAPALRARPVDRPRRARRRTSGAAARDPGRAAAAVPRRQGDRRRGTASRSPRSPRRHAVSSATDWLDAARARSATSCSARSAARTAACSAASREGRVSGTGFLDDHANVAHGLLELHVATGEPRWLLEARRIADLAVELFADDERGGFFLAPRDGERARDAAEGPRRRPDARRGTRCSPRC